MAGEAGKPAFLTGEDARLLMDEALACRFEASEVIVEAASRPRALFFVSSGAVRDGDARVEAPALLGEVAFVDGGATPDRIVAEEPCEVYIIDGGHVLELVEWAPDFGARLYATLAAQLARRLRAVTGLSASSLL
jgi:CRP-like cAMP-binding protein